MIIIIIYYIISFYDNNELRGTPLISLQMSNSTHGNYKFPLISLLFKNFAVNVSTYYLNEEINIFLYSFHVILLGLPVVLLFIVKNISVTKFARW